MKNYFIALLFLFSLSVLGQRIKDEEIYCYGSIYNKILKNDSINHKHQYISQFADTLHIVKDSFIVVRSQNPNSNFSILIKDISRIKIVKNKEAKRALKSNIEEFILYLFASILLAHYGSNSIYLWYNIGFAIFNPFEFTVDQYLNNRLIQIQTGKGSYYIYSGVETRKIYKALKPLIQSRK